MKISEASRDSGVSTSTFKYYIREGLVAEGARHGSNQTEYNDSHIRRVRVVRSLIETGRLSIAASREVLKVMDANLVSPAYFLEAAQHALAVDAAQSKQPRHLMGSPRSASSPRRSSSLRTWRRRVRSPVLTSHR